MAPTLMLSQQTETNEWTTLLTNTTNKQSR